MRLGVYRDFHLATEALRGTSLEVSVAEVVGRIRAALAEFASPRDVLEDVYWTVVYEPIADCLGLVDEVTLALDLADVACDVVAESMAAAFAAGYDGCGHCLAVFHRR